MFHSLSVQNESLDAKSDAASDADFGTDGDAAEGADDLADP